eukprot:6260981-Amphidinium_carterae.2
MEQLEQRYACCIVSMMHLASMSVTYHELFGQPFRTSHAVPDVCWVAKRLSRAGRGLLGLVLDPEKSQSPSKLVTVLGVHFDLAPQLQGELHVRPKPERVAALVEEFRTVLETDCLPPSQAAHLVGRADIVNSTLFGRVGRGTRMQYTS